MKEIKISNKIYEKNFDVKALGYCCEEVDGFLDEINYEVTVLEREISDLKEKLRITESSKLAAEQKNRELTIENGRLKAQNAIPSSSNANFSNMDVLNRISNLENMLQNITDLLNNNKSNDGRF